MQKKDRIDGFGAAALTGFALFLALNQIVIKLVNAGLQPVFFAGLRSAIAAVTMTLWLAWRRGALPRLDPAYAGLGLLSGLFFAAEFVFLFLALDLTTVTRTAILLYSMPIWMAVGAHLLIPGERISARKAAGLAVAFAGVALAFSDRGDGAAAGPQPSLLGDLFALVAAVCWAAIALLARGTRFREVRPELQLYWQVLVSAPVLIVASLAFGPLVRELQPWHLAGLLYQGVLVASAGFVFWLWLLSVYPASGVASFSFLTPVFGVALGWLVLGEHVGWPLLGALALVAGGLLLINRPGRSGARPA